MSGLIGDTLSDPSKALDAALDVVDSVTDAPGELLDEVTESPVKNV